MIKIGNQTRKKSRKYYRKCWNNFAAYFIQQCRSVFLSAAIQLFLCITWIILCYPFYVGSILPIETLKEFPIFPELWRVHIQQCKSVFLSAVILVFSCIIWMMLKNRFNDGAILPLQTSFRNTLQTLCVTKSLRLVSCNVQAQEQQKLQHRECFPQHDLD